jgi:hypothetical protein
MQLRLALVGRKELTGQILFFLHFLQQLAVDMAEMEHLQAVAAAPTNLVTEVVQVVALERMGPVQQVVALEPLVKETLVEQIQLVEVQLDVRPVVEEQALQEITLEVAAPVATEMAGQALRG